MADTYSKCLYFEFLSFLECKISKERGNFSCKYNATQLEGIWICENGNQRIDCNLNDEHTWLLCTWSNEYIEIFQLESENLTGVTNPEILGYPTEGDLIIWNTGNRWYKEGIDIKETYQYL